MSAPAEVHRRVPLCLVRLFDRAAEGRVAWPESDAEARRAGLDPVCIRTREELAALVEGSTEEIPREDHRDHHADDFRRWGRRGGLETLRRYGGPWFSLLALRRWEKVGAEALTAHMTTMAGRS